MIIKTAFILVSVLFFSAADAQILNPVKFTCNAKKTGSNQYELHVKAAIEPKWHLYSIKNPAGGAQATVVSFTGTEAVGKLKEAGKLKTVFEKSFGVSQKFFETTVDFIQVVKIKPGTKKINGSVEYMVCNDKQCLPPKEVAFEIKL